MSRSDVLEADTQQRSQTEPSRAKPRRPRLPSLRLLITLTVVAPIAIVSLALVIIAIITSRSVADRLGYEIVRSTTERVTADVHNYLDTAVRISELYVRRIQDQTLSRSNLASWEKTMFQDLAANPDIASICFANMEADCTWLLRAHGRLELGLVKGTAIDEAIEFPANEEGLVDRANPIRIYRFDAKSRPWFQIALASPQPTWTPVYFWFGGTGAASTTGTGYTRVVRGFDGAILGVLIIDVTLSAISDHLKNPPVINQGWVFIIDETGRLVAASEGAVNSPTNERLAPADSDSPAARAIARLAPIETPDGNVDAGSLHTYDRVHINDRPARAVVTKIEPFAGIHWNVVTALAEDSFLAKAYSLQRRAILLATGAIAAGVAVGMLLSKRLARPLQALTEHVARVGAGDFDSRLYLNHAAELHRLSEELNRMAGGLKQRMMLENSIAIATQVQQSLLPSSLPQLAGLQVAACSKYCESTGGDYYDFIHVPGLEGHGTLVAVGDVTGHGIGAAMLMSTARGAVRAASAGAISLGHILTRANNVLAGSAQQGMFMTLYLLFVNPKTGVAYWSSAGHDPAIVYHPQSDEFEELASGDIPLGIDPDIAYHEFSRPCAIPGSIIVVGTDGIWEARNTSGEMFGKDRLRKIIRGNAASADALSNAIKSAMYSWVGDASLQDDVTFVVIKVEKI